MLNQPEIHRMLSDLIVAELSRRQHRHLTQFLSLDTDLSDPQWRIDSLELMNLAGIVNEMFHLYETGIEDYLLRYRRLEKWVEIVYRSWHEYSEKLTFRTSGSQGEPKRCTHQFNTLLQETDELASLFADRTRIISMVSSHHIYGFLFTILLPRILQIDCLDGRYLSSGVLANTLQSGDLIVSFPDNWAYLEKSLPHFPENVEGMSSTGVCAPDLMELLKKKGLNRFTEIYGSSETGGIGYHHYPNLEYTLFSYWQSIDNDHLQRQLPENAGELTILTPDILKWKTPHTFTVSHRRDNAVSIGGINVYPQQVAHQICQHPKVKECSVRSFFIDGSPRLKAFVVPLKDAGNLREDLEQWMFKNLSTPERPLQLTFGESLPRNSFGKLIDWSS